MSTSTSSGSTRTTIPSSTSPDFRFLIGAPANASSSSMVVGSGPVQTRAAGAGAAVGADASRVSATGVLLSCVAICALPPSSGACTLTLFRFTGAFAFRTTASPPSTGVSLRDVFSWFSVTCIGTPSKFIRAHEATPRMQSRWGNHAIAFGEPTIGPRPRPQGSCST